MAKKKVVSFRIDPAILDKLSKSARDDRIALNALVDRIFDNYVNWDRPATKAEWVFVKKELLKSMINKFDNKEIQRLAIKSAKELLKDTLLSMTGKNDLDSWISITKNRSERSNFHYQQKENNGEISIIITHNMGEKWSLFHTWYYQQMLKELGYTTKTDYTDKTFIIKIKKKR